MKWKGIECRMKVDAWERHELIGTMVTESLPYMEHRVHLSSGRGVNNKF